MTSWKKICSILMMALFVTVGGTSFAAATAPSAQLNVIALFSGADTPSQDTPVDCKKKPDDPRCKNKPY
jgi:hypothetical protein